MSDHTKRSVNSPEKTKIRKWVCGFLLIALLGGFYGCGAYLYSMLHTAEKTITVAEKEVNGWYYLVAVSKVKVPDARPW